jgi:hypothetical protein
MRIGRGNRSTWRKPDPVPRFHHKSRIDSPGLELGPLQWETYKQINSVVLARKRTIPTERPSLVGEVSANFADRGCRVVSATDPNALILGFLDRSRYYFYEVVPQLYSRG